MGKPEIAGPRRARPGPPSLEPQPAPSGAPSEPPAAPVAPTPRALGGKTGRGRWFVLGAVLGALLGAVGALAARGEARATLLDLREWSARELRRLEHRSQSAMVAAPVVVASLTRPAAVADTAANAIPSVRVEDLPRVHPPTVTRRHHGRRAPPVAPVDPPADADEDPAGMKSSRVNSATSFNPEPSIASRPPSSRSTSATTPAIS